ncbi:hypothetical protein LTR97_000508 [Elasticomyces elasticus]|uniref:CMP/dCMP-type deaminase domain-containing protein n=1 Tax=Elasticomyces elasticus TaxID=574655 RepID=A0AAN8A5V8_9PEZI|nr:hypothetical protein LTR97_000508 [Elasticomyces elasticus]
MAWIAAALSLLAVVCMASFEQQASDVQTAARTPDREHWMQQAIQALYDLKSPCPFEAFGTVIVNHTAKEDDLICIGANAISSGNPTLHGEIAAINNCTAVLTDPTGRYRLSSAETLEAYKSLTLYTTAEPCPMCAAAVRWTGFRECVFGTSISTLGKYGWTQIDFTSQELFEHTTGLKTKTNLVGGVLGEETDRLFAWQFNPSARCPVGCERNDGSCTLATSESGSHIKTEL